jgi:hypothetical protein
MDNEYLWQGVAAIVGIFVLITAIVVVVIWQRGAGTRARAVLADQGEYRKLSENKLATEQVTERQLGDIVERLDAMQSRMEALERILKDVE